MNYIKRDIGLTRELDEYDITRFLDVLRKYYSELSLSEVKLAFELSSVGELNDFLPKNADGSVRNGHYQQFNVEYYTKILTAYRNKKNKVVTKAFTALPKRANKISIEERKQLHNGNLHNLTRAFLRYKYSGRYVTNGVEEYLHYRELEKTILAPTIHVSDSDKERALSLVYQKSAKRLITKFQADMISKGGKESKDIQTDAFFIARRRAIIKCFDYMIESEIQINKYLKFV
jgi:hypothetical protein